MTGREFCCFDLDGVLVDTRRVHFDALNAALSGHGHATLTWEWHEEHLDGLPTRTKLATLGIDDPAVERTKQQATRDLLAGLEPDQSKADLFDRLTAEGWVTGVASNAVGATVRVCLDRLGISPDVVVSNEDVASPKPNPAVYLLAMARAGVGPRQTAVIEDRTIGVQAAVAAGVRTVIQVTQPGDVTIEHLAPDGGWRSPLRRRGILTTEAADRRLR